MEHPSLDPEGQILLSAIHGQLDRLKDLLSAVEGHWHREDNFYRFYYGSFKVYSLQEDTKRIVNMLSEILPDRKLDPLFLEITEEGTGRVFSQEHNQRWPQETRPILEAFFHAHMMLTLAVQYGEELPSAPTLMPSGWAALLCLYQMR